jgi:5-methylcytosine-specific restriction endonuclease McrA
MEGKRSDALYCSREHKDCAKGVRFRAANPRYWDRPRAPQERTAYFKAYREQHRAAIKERDRNYAKQYREANPDAGREWLAANPEKRRLRHLKRRVVVRSGVYTVTDKDVRRLFTRFANSCAYCGAAGPLHLDHIFPISRGGEHRIGNLIPACPSCNKRKASRLLAEWRLRP